MGKECFNLIFHLFKGFSVSFYQATAKYRLGLSLMGWCDRRGLLIRRKEGEKERGR